WHVPGDRGDLVIGTRDERLPAVAAIARPFVGILVDVPTILANELHKSGLGWMDSVPARRSYLLFVAFRRDYNLAANATAKRRCPRTRLRFRDRFFALFFGFRFRCGCRCF